jgi:serine/threonine protein phosphatase 1
MLTYAIGDVHGCRDLLADLLAQISRHADGRFHRLVCLGDYIDRGSDSAGVLALLGEVADATPGGLVMLKGNHEDMLGRAIRDPDDARLWLINGGDATLRSFGAAGPADMPADVVAHLAGLPTAYEDERRCFVHAGLDPRRAHSAQTDEGRMWIRQPFLGSDHDFGKFVVHGHTPVPGGRPDLRRFRLNIDTGAVYGGPLTAAVFEGSQSAPTGFLQAWR